MEAMQKALGVGYETSSMLIDQGKWNSRLVETSNNCIAPKCKHWYHPINHTTPRIMAKKKKNQTQRCSRMMPKNGTEFANVVGKGRASSIIPGVGQASIAMGSNNNNNNNNNVGVESLSSGDSLELADGVHDWSTRASSPPEIGNPLHFYLPPIPCSTPATLHPLYHPTRHACDSWLVSSLKPKTLAYTQFLVQSLHPLFVCLTMPHALDSRILPLSKLLSVLFIVDNFSDELGLLNVNIDNKASMSERGYYQHIISLLQQKQTSAAAHHFESNPEVSKILPLLLHTWEEIKSEMPTNQQCRFIRILGELFDHTVQQSEKREGSRGGIIDLDSYLSFRKITGGGYVFMVMSEFGTGINLEDEVLCHPDIAKLQELVAYHVAYVNDLLSFRKEFCLGHHQNLVSVLCVHEGYNLQESVFKVCGMIRRVDDEFVTLKKRVSMNTSLVERKGVEEYVEVLGHVMSGFLEWSYQTGRYHGLNRHLVLRQGLVSLVHHDFTLITQGVVRSQLFADYA